MIQFSKLRISGFKSFVDRTELDIGPGLNGIVGPNGCGKSNLVESLRWVMGESSAKRMRGGGMEDVIFAGTDKRSSRNLAEVSLLLDNSARQAPSAYNSLDEIEVIRKIEKDKGSGYKINGKNARARDVQMLFADTVTGSNSPSLVSQGHVTRMINAKPQDRRLILEESAGIAGLYARRHEAELRLKAADSNLVRVEDVVGSMESRLNTLKRQSRQAAKYKNLSTQIRQLELSISYLEWQALLAKQSKTKKEFSTAETQVAKKLATVTQLTKTQNTQVEDLPALRKEEGKIAAILQKCKIELEQHEAKAVRHKNDLQETKTQIHQSNIDIQHEEQTLEESAELLSKIETEHKELLLKQEEDQNKHKAQKADSEVLYRKLTEQEERYTSLKETAAESRARENALTSQIERYKSNLEINQNRRSKAQKDKENLAIDSEILQSIKELESKTSDLEGRKISITQDAERKLQTINGADQNTNEVRTELSLIEKNHTELMAEISMLESFFATDENESFIPVLDQINTKIGFEKALSRALGDSLLATLDDDASALWCNMDHKDLLPLPDGSSALIEYVEAPKELQLTLSQIGYIEDATQGDGLAVKLSPGQSLVSSDGHYWRWDGYNVKAQAADRHSIHIEQKNKLRDLEIDRAPLAAKLNIANQKLESAIAKQKTEKDNYNHLLLEIKSIDSKLKDLQPALQKIRNRHLQNQSENKRFDGLILSLSEDIKTIEQNIDHDQVALKTLCESAMTAHNEETMNQAKSDLEQAKEEYRKTIREFDLLTQTQSTRSARIQAISDERVSLKNRSIRAREHLRKLNERLDELNQKLTLLEQQPMSTNNDLQDNMLDRIAELEATRNRAAEKLVRCEGDVSETATALKQAESILGQEREERARAQTLYASISEQLNDMEQRISEQHDIAPKDLVNNLEQDLIKHDSNDLPQLKSQKESFLRERNHIGAVNLQAEGEASELEKELTTLLHERNDLIQAIEELRGGINKINKEARERLLIAFEHVNAHFQRLFVRLFDGGKAHLKLIDSEDPLGAGLEIFAQPPGKALQSLSLLSGGEQTLASIALIFGMFLTNPSPICVLDEIDAPLDDANVDRVCNLLEEIAERGDTRFLVITHHRLTMARMDRLYGVTMREKGVSQLVSVDLQQSFSFTDQRVA